MNIVKHDQRESVLNKQCLFLHLLANALLADFFKYFLSKRTKICDASSKK